MSDTPLVSIIIPTFNCEKYIKSTIDCLLAQSYKNIEIIVIDDGSTDRTVDMVQAYPIPVRLIQQSNSGVCKARNHGLSNARGDFICFMDHDDYWFPDKLTEQMDTLDKHPEVGIVYSSFINWQEAPDGTHADPSSFSLDSYGTGIDAAYSGWIYHLLLLDCWMLTSTAMFRRSVFTTSGTFDESLPYSEDWDLWLRISREQQFIKLKRPNTLYRQHQHQGNRVIREVDYRSQLLAAAVRRWGLCSPDGRGITSYNFHTQLSKYRSDYALHHLKGGNTSNALKCLLDAWLILPTNLKPLAYGVAAIFGWKPKW